MCGYHKVEFRDFFAYLHDINISSQPGCAAITKYDGSNDYLTSPLEGLK